MVLHRFVELTSHLHKFLTLQSSLESLSDAELRVTEIA